MLQTEGLTQDLVRPAIRRHDQGRQVIRHRRMMRRREDRVDGCAKHKDGASERDLEGASAAAAAARPKRCRRERTVGVPDMGNAIPRVRDVGQAEGKRQRRRRVRREFDDKSRNFRAERRTDASRPICQTDKPLYSSANPQLHTSRTADAHCAKTHPSCGPGSEARERNPLRKCLQLSAREIDLLRAHSAQVCVRLGSKCK